MIGGSRPDRLTLNGYSSPLGGSFGVFDGHGGDRASRYCAEHLFPKIATEITTHNAAVDAAITSAVRAVDAEFCTIARRTSHPDLELQRAARFQSQLPGGRSLRSFAMEDGSTCLVAIIRDGTVHVGNVGDSRAILATRAGKSVSLSDGAFMRALFLLSSRLKRVCIVTDGHVLPRFLQTKSRAERTSARGWKRMARRSRARQAFGTACGRSTSSLTSRA